MSRDIGLQLRVIYQDNDVLELRVSVWNGKFGGTADAYVALGELREIATALQGFPDRTSDTREVVLGAFGAKTAGGAVSLGFYCIDGSGHAALMVKLESDYDSSGAAESVTLRLPIEPAALDAFVEDLYKVDTNQTKTAFLRGII